MRICDLISIGPRGEEEVRGQFSWDGKELHLSEGMPPELLDAPVYTVKGRITAHDDPGEWFEELPRIFSGEALRAKMRGGEKEGDMISDTDDSAERLHRALDRILNNRAPARDDSEGRANVARKAWQTRHETGGTQKLSESEREGPQKKKMKTQNIKPFGWTAKQTQRRSEHPDQKPMIKPRPTVKPV